MNAGRFLAFRTTRPNLKKVTQPCRFGDVVSIETWIDAFEGRKFTIRYEMTNGEHLAATCCEHRAWVLPDPDSPRGLRAIPVPDEIRKLFHRPA